MKEKIPTPVAIGIAIVAVALVMFFGFKYMNNATATGVPDELAKMQAEAEAKRSPGYGKTENSTPVPGEPPTGGTGFSPGRRPEGGP